MKNRLHHESREPIEEPIHPDQQRRTRQGQEVSLKITCPALELNNIQDGYIGLHLQVLRGGTHPSGVSSHIFFARISLLLQLVSFTVDSDPL